jgi:hypothetical protein
MAMLHLAPIVVGATHVFTSVVESGSETSLELAQPSSAKSATQGGLGLLTSNRIVSPGSASKVPVSFDRIHTPLISEISTNAT